VAPSFKRDTGICQPLGAREQGFSRGGDFGHLGTACGALYSTFWGELPLLTVFLGPEALKVHFRCIYDGLLFRRFRSQVPGDPKKLLGGSASSSRGPLTHFSASRKALHPLLDTCGGHR
jgi:hypothetical protein